MNDPSAWLPFGPLPDLEAELDLLCSQLPSGSITTFGHLAAALGDIKAASWIGRILKSQPGRHRWPWHRVVLVDGSLPGTNSKIHAEQAELLRQEGLAVVAGRVETNRIQAQFDSTAPLIQLRQTQEELQTQSARAEPLGSWNTIAGVDVAYPRTGLARAAYVEIDRQSGQVLHQQQLTADCRFPYIPGYLSYREIPALLDLLRAVLEQRPLADVLMVDGSGQLHPRRFGIACHLGAILQHPTLGVSKKLLCGKLAADATDTLSTAVELPPGTIAGYAINRPTETNRLYVSAGHQLDALQAREIAVETWGRHPLPDPTFYADRLTRNKPLQ